MVKSVGGQMSSAILATIIPSIILLGALVTDLRSHKIFNSWVMISIVLAACNAFYFFGWSGLQEGAIAGLVVLVVMIPLVLIGALGAGDMKVLFAFALTSTFQEIFSVLIFSILWGAVIGIVTAIFKGQIKRLFGNTLGILTGKVHDTSQFQKVPYTAALILGWLTYLVIGFSQGGLF